MNWTPYTNTRTVASQKFFAKSLAFYNVQILLLGSNTPWLCKMQIFLRSFLVSLSRIMAGLLPGIKGRVQQDFSLPVFFVNRLNIGP
jgi:hypothetical protein